MEIVIATTTPERAEQMRNLVGHTMSGEALERRPQVQFTGAADFLDAALKLYDITAIRLAPSTKSEGLIDVWASYEPHVFICEACGGETSAIPSRLYYDLEFHKNRRHSWCSTACHDQLQERMTAEYHAYRASLGDPVEAALSYLRLGQPYPEKLRTALTEIEHIRVLKGCDAMYKAAWRGLVQALASLCVQHGADLASLLTRRCEEHSAPVQLVQRSLWDMEGAR